MRLRVPLAPLVAVLLFVALCAICAAWALQLLAPRTPVAPAGTVGQGNAPIDLRLAASLLGKAPAPQAVDTAPAGPSDIKVAGVIAAGARGVALLSINGQPAKPFAVGETVDAETTVIAVSADSVSLRRRGQTVKSAAPERPSLAILTSGPTERSAKPAPSAAPPMPGAAPMPVSPPPPSGALIAPAQSFASGPGAAPAGLQSGMPNPGSGRPGAAPLLAPTDPPLLPPEPPPPQNAGMISIPAPGAPPRP